MHKGKKQLLISISLCKNIEGATVRIIADDVVWQSFDVGKKTDPISFSLNVTDVNYIRFEVDLKWSSGVIISDVELKYCLLLAQLLITASWSNGRGAASDRNFTCQIHVLTVLS